MPQFAILFGEWFSRVTEGKIISGSVTQQTIIGNKTTHLLLAPIIPQLFACYAEGEKRKIINKVQCGVV